VLISRDGVWRAEQRADGWWLTWRGGLILSRASLDRLTAYLLEQDVDPVRDLTED
jgi:hypothetical protein